MVFNKIVGLSSQYAFEVDNFAFNAVPEPNALFLFGIGLLALVVFAQRRRWGSMAAD